MKINTYFLSAMVLFLSLNHFVFSQGVVISTNESATSDPSAMLDVQSTEKGMLVPRMTQTQRDAIQNPATSVLIYQIDGEPGFYYNAGTPATPNWQLVGSNAGVFSQWTTNGSGIHYNNGNVGIGTDSPISLLSVDAGINVDQSNSNGFGSLASALTFGNNKQVGIASNRSNSGNVQKGMDLYTGGVRRISIDSIGNVGIGTTTPQYRLDVSGTARFNNILFASYRLGIGVSNPDYPLHTSTGYFTTRVGIGTIPNSTYALDLAGSSRFQGNMRVTGNVISENNVVVQNNRGIVRSNTSTQYKIVPFTLTFSINAGPGGNFVTGNVSYGETFSAQPIVMVGSITSASGTAGTLAWLNILPWNPGNSGTTFYIANVGTGTATFSTVTVRCLAIGPQ
jgi:hypothetical protein